MSQTSLSIDQDAFMSSSVPSTSSSSSASSSPSPWHELPEDVYLLVFALLDPVSLSRAARVCRLWRQVVASKTLWRRVRLPYVSKQKLRLMMWKRVVFVDAASGADEMFQRMNFLSFIAC